MTSYRAPARDIDFLLHEVMRVTESDIPGYADLDRTVTRAIVDEAGKLSAEVYEPLNVVGDREGCRLENGVVRTPTGFKAAFDKLREGGWTGIDCAEEYGGQGMPNLIGTAVGELWVSGNMALNMYHGLTHGAYSTIHAHGTEAQRNLYLPKLASCEWTGTMNLTEPHAGTDLGLLRTRAEPQADGSYRITGTKIFISAGDHDMADNIIHLVLARIPGAPEGVKGISLFIVPKVLVNEDGALGARNAVSVGALEDKMGIHGNATCVMNYDGATGYLLGEAHKGLKAMFTMMNEARLAVGVQGLGVASVAYQNAAGYARDRLQGRRITGPAEPDQAADPIIVHPDVRRMLMSQKSFVEGARAVTYWAASLIDRAARMDDKGAEALAGLLIPVVKGTLTDRGFASAVMAQQIWGGHGYIEENGMSQYARDARIAMIYEGANGIQALDLVGRKLPAQGGKAAMAFFALVKDFIRQNEADTELKAEFLDPLKSASKDLQAAATYFVQEGMKSPDNALAGATDFMHLFGHVVFGLMWAEMAKAARAGLAEGHGEPEFYRTKLATGRYYMARELPETRTLLARIETGATPVMALAAEAF
ncbi:MAG: acyl-CoA dehydrogenase C-terminal domain-containing protein [Maritimibacter sp.]|nr:acyl-CoA dehydrogenase C-terminal domain-containing protein [Maritimibacter sp.]